MRTFLSGAVLSLAMAPLAMAEPRSFAVTDPSGQFLLEVLFAELPKEPEHLAPVLITVRDRQTLETLQQLQTQMDDPPEPGAEGTSDWLSGPYGVLNFGDFNFDGRQDVAIRDASEVMEIGTYRYNVYLQDAQQRTWALHPALTELARDTPLGLFQLDSATRTLRVQTQRGCCWRRDANWQFKGGELLLASAVTEEEIPPNESQGTSMPRGYVQRTRGALHDGTWQEQTRIEGPITESPQMLTGTLDGKLPVQLWFQDQGTVIIGEVRYTQSGSGAPIQLVGERDDYDDKPNVYLFEFADDGRQTGIWRMTADMGDPGAYTGTWIDKVYSKKPELALHLRHGGPEPAATQLGDVAPDQRSGRYQMLDDFLGRNGYLDLAVLPERDAEGREIAQFSLRLEDSKTGVPIISEQHRVPMEADNLIIVREAQASKGNGAYHIQLVKGFAVVKYNAAPDNPQMMTGMYRKQP